MSVFGKTEAYRQAIAVVTAGLASQAIKLNGTHGKGTGAVAEYSTADAEYLNDLIAKLAKSLTAPQAPGQ